jgi:hypothetical protein
MNADPQYVNVATAAPARGPILSALDKLFDRLLDGKLNASNASQAVRRLIHSELASRVVDMTPTPADDVILALLREVIPEPDVAVHRSARVRSA